MLKLITSFLLVFCIFSIGFTNAQVSRFSFNKYTNGKIDVPAAPSVVVTVDAANVKAALIDSGYYKASDFTGLK